MGTLEINRYTHGENKHHVNMETEMRVTSQEMPKIASKPPEARKET
jgi:hypothetical protein